MLKTIEVFRDELRSIRTGRANPEIFRKVKVECYGTVMALSDTATVTVVEGRNFLIQAFDKSNLRAIETAIANSDLGLNPTNDGDQIRIVLPALSQDRRNELVKQVNGLAEERGRVVLRGIRQDMREKLKKLKGEGISEDQLKKANDDLEKLTSKYVSQVDELAQQKEKELLTV